MKSTDYGPSDHLYMLTEGYKHLTVDMAEWADIDTVKYWMILANCNACTIPGQSFEDLFPAAEVAKFRDLAGSPLNELGFEFSQHHAPRKVFYPAPEQGDGRVEYQLDYVRWYLVPRFAATLVNLFSSLIFTYRNYLGGEMGEPPERNKDIPCPSLVWNGLAPAGDAAQADDAEAAEMQGAVKVGCVSTRPAGALSPKERFFNLLEEMESEATPREQFLQKAREVNLQITTAPTLPPTDLAQ